MILSSVERKYLHQADMAQAIAFYSTGDEAGMMDALERACRLGNQDACDEMKSFSLNLP